jgi:hypothetical protein
MTTTTRFRLAGAVTLLICSAASAIASAQATLCLPQALPVVEKCGGERSDPRCCPDIRASPLNIDDSYAGVLCTQAFFHEVLRPQLDVNIIRQHNELQNMQTETFTDWPNAVQVGGSTWWRHFVSTALLAGVDYVPGQSWHSSTLDYLQAVRGNDSPFHDDYSHLQVIAIEGTGHSDSRHTYSLFGRDSIRLSCAHFGHSAIHQASVLLHESWHMVFGAHDSNGQDPYLEHAKTDLGPGDMGEPILGFPGARPQSVYQTQYNFFCDIMRTPQRWVPNRTLAQAYFAHGYTRAGLVPTPVECRTRGIERAFQPVFGAPPRVLHLRVQGTITNVRPILSDIQRSFDERFDVLVPTSHEGVLVTDFIVHLSSGDLRFGFVAVARLLPDDETVSIAYEGSFFDENGFCLGDTAPTSFPVSGHQCEGVGQQAAWKTIEVHSLSPSLPPIPRNLNDNWLSSGDGDNVDFSVTPEIEW